MKRNRAIITKFAALSLVLSVPMTSGCDILGWFGPNTTITAIVPLGFGGSPGLYNPFGIVQAFVNSLLGVGGSTGDTTDTTSSTAAAVPGAAAITSAATTAPPGTGAITAVVAP